MNIFSENKGVNSKYVLICNLNIQTTLDILDSSFKGFYKSR